MLIRHKQRTTKSVINLSQKTLSETGNSGFGKVLSFCVTPVKTECDKIKRIFKKLIVSLQLKIYCCDVQSFPSVYSHLWHMVSNNKLIWDN